MSAAESGDSFFGYMVGDTVYSLANPDESGRVTAIAGPDDEVHKGLLRIRWSHETDGDPQGYWQGVIGLEPPQR